MSNSVRDQVIVLDIGGTTTRAARINGTQVEKVVQCPTPTVMMLPDVSVELLQAQLVELSYDLVSSVTRDAEGEGEAPDSPMRIAITFSGRVAPGGRTVVSAPDIWGTMPAPYDLASEIESRTGGSAVVRVCNDVVAAAAQYGKRTSQLDHTYALLMVRTGLQYVICNPQDPGTGDGSDPVLLGHQTMPEAPSQFACTCGDVDHFTAYASGTGIVNVLISSSLQSPKAFRSSYLFRLAAQRYEKLRFEQRVSLFRRHAVRMNGLHLIDEDVWRNMHDKHAEITPGELQRWVFPALLDAGMFIEAVLGNDEYALQLLDLITAPVARHLEEQVIPHVDVVALTGGFARQLGDAYRSRIAPPENPELVQWAEDTTLDDLRAAREWLWPADDQAVIDLREPAMTKSAL